MKPRQILITDRPLRRRFWRSGWMLLGSALCALQVTTVPVLHGWESRTEVVEKANGYQRQKEVLAVTITLTSGSSWTVPSDWNNASNTIDVYGGGGAGGAAPVAVGAGGGGGAFSRKNNATLTPSASIPISVGAGGTPNFGTSTGNPGADTWFSSTGYLLAKGGFGGSPGNSGGGGSGGFASSGVGDLKYSGGAAANAGSGTYAGGAAGPSGNGAAGMAGGAGGGGYAGAGAHNPNRNTHNAGNLYGGGGGDSAAGAQGIIAINYTPAATPKPRSFGYVH